MFDLVIIGGGPAGLTAGIYAQRARLKTVLLEKQMVGGQIAVSDIIENYPGFPSISGAGLMEKFEEHARGLGLEIRFADVADITVEDGVKVIKTSEGEIGRRPSSLPPARNPRGSECLERRSLPARAYLIAPPATALFSGTSRSWSWAAGTPL